MYTNYFQFVKHRAVVNHRVNMLPRWREQHVDQIDKAFGVHVCIHVGPIIVFKYFVTINVFRELASKTHADISPRPPEEVHTSTLPLCHCFIRSGLVDKYFRCNSNKLFVFFPFGSVNKMLNALNKSQRHFQRLITNKYFRYFNGM